MIDTLKTGSASHQPDRNKIPADLLSVYRHPDRNRSSDFLFRTQKFYRLCIHYDFVGGLRFVTFGGLAESQFHRGIVHIIELSVAFDQFRIVHAAAHQTIIGDIFDQFVIFDFAVFFICDIFQHSHTVSAGLTHRLPLKIFDDAAAHGKECGKQQRGQRDGDDGDDISGHVSFQAFVRQIPHCFFVVDFKHCDHLRFCRLRCG